VGSKGGFTGGVKGFAKGLMLNPEFCRKKSIISLDQHFSPQFDVDWCQFRLEVY